MVRLAVWRRYLGLAGSCEARRTAAYGPCQYCRWLSALVARAGLSMAVAAQHTATVGAGR